MRRLSALVVPLLACGDNHRAPITAHPTSGTRLQLQQLEYEDGTRQLASTSEVFDGERGESCTITRWSDGLRYCTPKADTAVYIDADCSILVGRRAPVSPLAPAAQYFLHELFVAGEFLPSKLFWPGAPFVGEVAANYELRDGACTRRFDRMPFETYVVLGDQVSKSDLVHTIRVSVPTDERLETVVDTSPDGLRLPAAMFDVELGDDCLPTPIDAANARCNYVGFPLSFPFADAACTEPVVIVPAIEQPPTTVTRITGSDSCSSFHPVGSLLPNTSTYTRIGSVCTEIPLPIGDRAFALDGALELATLERRRIPSDRRLQTIEDGDSGFPDRFAFDTELGRECLPIEIGQRRCIPPFFRGDLRYTDPGCLNVVLVAAVHSRCGPAFELVQHPNSMVFHPIGAPSPTIYELTTGDRCVEAVPPDGATFHDTGDPFELTAFAAATIVTE